MRVTITKDRFHRFLIEANLIWAVIAPLFLAMVLNVIQVQGLFIIKDLLFYLSLFATVLLVRSKELVFFLLRLFFFVAFLLLITAIFYELKPWIVYNLRQLLAPLLIISFGYYAQLSDESATKLFRLYYKIAVATIIVGVIIKQFNLWSIFDLTNYFNLKGIPVDSRGLSYMFYEPAFSYAERLASTILDPISLGHILAGAIIMCFYGVAIKGRKRWVYLFILAFGLLATFSKGAILQVVLALFFFNKSLSIKIRFLVPAICVAVALLLINIDGILIHIIGFKNAIVHMNLFGHGIGMVGNYAKMFADDLTVYRLYEISDTFIGSVLGQIGVIGLVIWLSFFSDYAKQVIFKKRTMIGATLILSQLIVAALSENTLNFTSFIVPGILGGIMARKRI